MTGDEEEEIKAYLERRGGAKVLVIEGDLMTGRSPHNIPALIAAAMHQGLQIVYDDRDAPPPPPMPTPIDFDDLPRTPRSRRAAHRGASLLELMHGLGARTKPLWSTPYIDDAVVCSNCDGAPDGGHTADRFCRNFYDEDQ